MKNLTWVFLLSLLWSCSNQLAGGDGSGSGTETTNAIAGFVVDQNQQPALARVTLFKTLEQGSEFIDSTWTNSQGRYEFTVTDSDSDLYALEISEPNSGLGRWVSDVLFAGDTLRQDTLGATWNLQGTVELQPGFDNRVVLRGTSWQAPIDNQGNWQLAGVYPGNHLLLHQVGNTISNEWLSVAAIPINGPPADSVHLRPLDLFADSGRMVLDDFEDLDGYNNLQVPWWSFNDQATGGNSQVVNWSKEELILTDSGNGLVSMNIEFGEVPPVYVGIGTNFYRPAYRYNVAVDLRNLDSIRLRWRGQNVRISLKLLSPLVASDWAKWDLGEASDSWTSVTVAMDSSEVNWSAGSPYAPSVGGNLVNQMIFVIQPITLGTAATFELDDVELIARSPQP